MTRNLLKTTALGLVMSTGLATGAIAANEGPDPTMNNTHAAVEMDHHNDTAITMESLFNDRVMAADEQELGRIINVYQADETADPYLIVDRGVAYDPTVRYVPIRYDSIARADADNNAIYVTTTRTQFDTAPAYSAESVNADLDAWPDRVDAFWQDKYANDRGVNVTVSEAVNVRPNDLSTQAPGYQTPGATPSN